jgi:TetR/AcrR family transcriptional repressor of nem operon
MLASEYATLPKPVQQEVRCFFELIETWLAGICEQGRDSGELRIDEQPLVVAAALLGSLEGLLIAARTFGDEQKFVATAGWLVSGLIATTSADRSS